MTAMTTNKDVIDVSKQLNVKELGGRLNKPATKDLKAILSFYDKDCKFLGRGVAIDGIAWDEFVELRAAVCSEDNEIPAELIMKLGLSDSTAKIPPYQQTVGDVLRKLKEFYDQKRTTCMTLYGLDGLVTGGSTVCWLEWDDTRFELKILVNEQIVQVKED